MKLVYSASRLRLVKEQVYIETWFQVYGQIREQVWHQVRNQVSDQIWSQVCQQVYKQRQHKG